MNNKTLHVKVICDDSSHRTKKAIVATLWLNRSLEAQGFKTHKYRWQMNPSPSTKPTVIRNDGTLHQERTGKPTSLLNDEPWKKDVHGIEAEGKFVLEGRTQYNLKCPLCRRTIPITGERLDSIMSEAEDTIRHAGLSFVTLAWLGRKLVE